MGDKDSIPDPTTQKIKKELNKGKPLLTRLRDNFSHFLVDYNVVPSTIAFLFAFMLSNIVASFEKEVISRFLPIKSKLIKDIITLVIVAILSFLFVEFIFYTLIYTPKIEREKNAEEKIKKITEKYSGTGGVEQFW